MNEASRPPENGVSVLIVEDETDMCVLMHDQLEGEGYAPVCATSDAGAYRALTSQSFAALVVDINLVRGTTGFDVARHARRLNPKIAVIYVTGGAPESVALHGVGGAALVLKPFNCEDLLDALDEVGVGRRDNARDESPEGPNL